MTKKSSFATAAVDFGCGVLAFAVVRVVPLVTGQHQDIRPFVLTTFLAFLTAALYRAAINKRSWQTLLTVSLGGIVPAATLRLLRISLTAGPFFILFLSTSVLAVVTGIILKLIFSRGKGALALTMGGLATLMVVGLAYKVVPSWLDRHAYQYVNQAVAPFSLRTLEGETVRPDALRGHVVVLSFWATWCMPCQAELPRIQTVARHYSGNSKVSIFAVDSGTEGDTPEKVRSYLANKRLDLAATIDSTDGETAGPAARSVGVPSLPALYIVDSMGKLRIIHLGYEASEDLENSLERQIDNLP